MRKLKDLEENNMSELLGKYYDKDTTKSFELVVNKLLKKKYKWFDRIVINRLSFSKSQNYMGIEAELFADEDWVGNQWREFYYSKPIPSGTEEDPIVLGELIGGEISKELQDDFKTAFMFITSEHRPKYMSHSWIVVKPIEMSRERLIEHIRRILRENDYSPAGKEVIPNSIVVHKSNPMFREEILKNGLKVKTGECYKIYVGYGTKCKPAIFATNSTNKRAWFDSTYDDDIWEINTEMIPDVKWYKDRHFESRSKHIVTFQDIPRDAITLKYEGSGRDGGMLEESIRRILREETESRMVNVMQDSIDKVGITSTIMIFGGFKVFKDYLDKLTFTNKDKMDFIKYVLNELGGLSLSELGWQPIPYNNNGDEYKEIVYLGMQRVIVDVWGGHNYETHQGEFGVHYYNLNDDILDDIFNKLLTIATENGLI